MFFYPKVMRQKVAESCVEEDAENADEDHDMPAVKLKGNLTKMTSGGILHVITGIVSWIWRYTSTVKQLIS